MEKTDPFEDMIRTMRGGGKVPCSCGGNISAVGNPKTAAAFQCDKCKKAIMFTRKH